MLEFQGERWGECVANSACSKSSEAALLGFLIGRFADWPIMIDSPLQRALTFQIVDSNLLDDVGAGPAPTIHHHVQEHLQLRRRHGFPARLRARRASR